MRGVVYQKAFVHVRITVTKHHTIVGDKTVPVIMCKVPVIDAYVQNITRWYSSLNIVVLIYPTIIEADNTHSERSVYRYHLKVNTFHGVFRENL